jgi:hypothetical protein
LELKGKNYAAPTFFLLGSSSNSKKMSIFFFEFFIPYNTSISIRKVMTYSMFISEVENIRNFVLHAIMTSLKKKHTMIDFELTLDIFPKKES